MYFSKKVKYPTITKIFKLLFFLDFEHFKQVGRPVTNQKYYTWDFGPAPKEIWIKIQSDEFIEEFGSFIGFLPFETETGKEGSEIIAKKNPDLTIFTPREIELMDKIILKYEYLSPSEISEISHLKNEPWDRTIKEKGKGKEIDYMLAIDNEALISKEEARANLIEREEMFNNYPFLTK